MVLPPCRSASYGTSYYGPSAYSSGTSSTYVKPKETGIRIKTRQDREAEQQKASSAAAEGTEITEPAGVTIASPPALRPSGVEMSGPQSSAQDQADLWGDDDVLTPANQDALNELD